MKRERLNTAEVEMNNGALDINIFNMLKNRQEAVALINEKWGLEISVDLNFAVFNEANGNANGGEEPSDETPDGDGDEIIGEEITESEDNELQVDGVKEDEKEPENTAAPEEPEQPTMEEEISKEIGEEGEDK
jgi:hypothetical protein